MRSDHHLALQLMRGLWTLFLEPTGNPLVNALMSPFLIVVVSKFSHDPTQLLLAEDQEMITTFSM